MRGLFGFEYLNENNENGQITYLEDSYLNENIRIKIYKLKDFVLFFNGLALCKKTGILIRDSYFPEWYLDLILDSINTPQKLEYEKLEDDEYIPLIGIWDNSFWHWMLEYLQRVIIAEKSGFKGKYLVFNDAHFKLSSLKLLGIDEKRLHLIDYSKNFFIKNLVLSEKIYPIEDKTPKIRYLQEIMRNKILSNFSKNESKNNRIYIIRGNAKNGRSIKNEEEVIELLQKYNFKTYSFDNLTLDEQIEISSSANVLVGGHGGSILHSLFMPPKSTVIEFFSPNYINYGFNSIIDLLGHHYYPLVSLYSSTNGLYYDTDVNAPVEVPIDTLKVILKNNLG